jgi:hypothetical protein
VGQHLWRGALWLRNSRVIIQGEKQYWLHIALGRDLVGGNVDVLGTQLEEVTE